MRILLLALLLPCFARADMAPELKQLKSCQAQAGLKIVFNADNYVHKWHLGVERNLKAIEGFRAHCEKIREKFPGEESRISALKLDKDNLVREVKTLRLKLDEVLKYTGDLRKDMEEHGGAAAKSCIKELRELDTKLPELSDLLAKDAASTCDKKKN